MGRARPMLPTASAPTRKALSGSRAFPGSSCIRVREGGEILDTRSRRPGLLRVHARRRRSAHALHNRRRSGAAWKRRCSDGPGDDVDGCWHARAARRRAPAGPERGRRRRIRNARLLAQRPAVVRSPSAGRYPRLCPRSRPGPFADKSKGGSAMRAVDALMECLKAEGVDVVFGLPGGANLPTYDAFYDAGIRHVLVRHEAGGGHAAEGYAQGDRQGRRRAGDVRPRRDEPRHADRRRDDGLGPAGLHHRPGAHRAARHRWLPGDRLHRHHDADRQALLPGPARARDPAHDQGGVPRRAQRPARARSSSTSRRTVARPSIAYRRSPTSRLPGLPADDRGQPASRSARPPRRSATARRPVIYAGGGVINAERRGGAARAGERPASRSTSR